MQFEKVLEGIDDIAHEFNHGVEKKELCKQVVAQLYSYSGQQVRSLLHWQREAKATPLWGMGLGWEIVPGEARGRCSTTTLGVVYTCELLLVFKVVLVLRPTAALADRQTEGGTGSHQIWRRGKR